MTIAMMRKAITLYSNSDVPKTTRRHLQRQWLRSMELLGDKHVLAKPIKRTNMRDNRILSH